MKNNQLHALTIRHTLTMTTPGTLVYLYGPPAVGKLTVASALQDRTAFRLFHNHLTVNAMRSVFDFGTPAFTEVLHRVRLDVFQTAARNGVDLIFTNNSAWTIENGRARFAAFAASVREAVEAQQGRVVFVQLTAPAAVLRARVTAESRRTHEKLLDPERLHTILSHHDPRPLHEDDLIIDTSTIEPPNAAALIDQAHALST